MKKHTLPFGVMVIIAACVWLLMPQDINAVNPSKKDKVDLVWSKKTNGRGLYSRQSNNYISNGVTLAFNGLYYYGDVDADGIALSDGFKTQNLSLGGSAAFAYTMPLGSHFNWRFGLSLGSLRGNNEDTHEFNYKKFNSIFLEGAAGIEYYPFTKAGLYLYAGVALNYSHLKFTYNYGYEISGTQDNILPMIPIELGYDFQIGRSWLLRIYAGVHQGVMDAPHFNLDGYPQVKEQNSANMDMGRAGANKWADGYFMIGVSISYRWHNCEQCRLYK